MRIVLRFIFAFLVGYSTVLANKTAPNPIAADTIHKKNTLLENPLLKDKKDSLSKLSLATIENYYYKIRQKQEADSLRAIHKSIKTIMPIKKQLDKIEKEVQFFPYFLAGVALGGCLVGAGLVFLIFQPRLRKIKEQIEELKEFIKSSQGQNRSGSATRPESGARVSEPPSPELQIKLEKILNKIDYIEQNLARRDFGQIETRRTESVARPSSEQVLGVGPAENGYFKMEPERVFFKITHAPGASEGKLAITSNAGDHAFIIGRGINKILPHYCEMEGFIDASAKKITMISPGRVVSDGPNKWRLQEKMRVRLEK